MYLEREVRDQLKALSKEIFGSQSKYQKLLDKGSTELLTKTVVETVPGENGQPDTQKEVKVPVLTQDGVKQFVQVYYTPESLLEKMVEIKNVRDKFMADMKAQQEEAEAKKAAEEKLKDLQAELAGSAVT